MLLIEAPFEPLQRGRLAPALLKAELQQRGLGCDVEHLGHAFAALLGREEYGRLIGEVPPAALAPDWVFAEALFGSSTPAPGAYVSDVLRGRWRLPHDLVDLVVRARRLAAGFLLRSLAELDWPRYTVLGFSAPVGQTVAALAVAKAVKEHRPDVQIVLGGPAWHGVMGRRQLACFPFVDAACTGDGDDAFPAYCAWVATGCEGPSPRGLLLRGGVGRSQRRPPPSDDLDALPIPDYTDLYGALDRWGGDARGVQLAAEASRGCWWAARRPCAFCGLSGHTRRYRHEVGRPHPLRAAGAGPALAALAHRPGRQRRAARVPSRGAAPTRRVAAHGAPVLRGAPRVDPCRAAPGRARRGPPAAWYRESEPARARSRRQGDGRGRQPAAAGVVPRRGRARDLEPAARRPRRDGTRLPRAPRAASAPSAAAAAGGPGPGRGAALQPLLRTAG